MSAWVIHDRARQRQGGPMSAPTESAIPIHGKFSPIARRSIVGIVSTDSARNNLLRFDLPGLSRGGVISSMQNLSHFIRATTWRRSPMVNIWKFLKDENGATAIEYGLIAAGVSVPIIATVTSLGSN